MERYVVAALIDLQRLQVEAALTDLRELTRGCSKWYSVSILIRYALLLYLLSWTLTAIRNPFGYQPWREKRSFDVGNYCAWCTMIHKANDTV